MCEKDMTTTRVKLVALFICLWLIMLVTLYSKSGFEESMETEMLQKELRRAQENVKMLADRNKALERELLTSKAEKLVGGEIEVVKRDSNSNELNGECQRKVINLENLVRELRAFNDGGQKPEEGGKHGMIIPPGQGPSMEHEKARFRLADNIQELWYYLNRNLKKLGSTSGNELLEDVAHRHRSIEADLIRLSRVDNTEAWREQEHFELQSLMQRRLHHLQHPKDCSKAKKVLCDLNKGCGFGCQLHHVVYCFMIAYGTERTLILQSKGWRYAHQGWDSVFLPLSESCTEAGTRRVNWNGEKNSKDAEVVVLPIVDALHNHPPYMPLSYPEDIAPRLEKLHGDPSVWFIAQFVKYLMRPQPHLQLALDEAKQKLKFQNPIVGIHVRRTDKVGTEAAFHGIEEYMEHVEEWFLRREVQGEEIKRRVYIASDDASVLPDAKKKYPNYEFYGDAAIARSAGLGSRYSDSSLQGLILDIHLLSLTDYLVCTFSSQVCRVAYEIMQTLHPDAARYFHSLDDIYYFGGQTGHEETAIYKHVPRNKDEIALEVGDVVGIAGNHWDGYSKGRSRRTGGIGLYPSYKTVDKKVVVKYPIYEQVPLTET